jgi:hypothetical protein
MRENRATSLSLLVPLVFLMACSKAKESVQTFELKKSAEILEFHGNEAIQRFSNIDDICIDNADNLYVADSGWNKILKFNKNYELVTIFGEQGQGPGEFIAEPRSNPLRISFGNDRILYLLAPLSREILMFSTEGQYLGGTKLSYQFCDHPCANARGEIFLISRDPNYVVFAYDKNRVMLRRLVKRNEYVIPLDIKGEYIDDILVKKVLTNKDELVVCLNYSQRILHFDEKGSLVNSFTVDNAALKADLQKRKELLSPRSFIAPFELGLDSHGIIYLFYANSTIGRDEVYRYSLDGRPVDILRIPEYTTRTNCITSSGDILISNEKNGEFKIEVYKMIRPAKGYHHEER